jgi:hypothetical protein
MNFLTLQTKMIIITPALPGGSACPLILRGRFRVSEIPKLLHS